jgi:hypothetical protein
MQAESHGLLQLLLVEQDTPRTARRSQSARRAAAVWVLMSSSDSRRWKKTARLPLPPYGRELTDARRRGQKPNVHIHAGDRAWDRAKMRKPPEVLVCPSDADYRQYDWTACRGLSVTLIVWGRDAEAVEAFAEHLIRSGAELVCTLNAFEGEDGEIQSMFYRARPR